MICLGVAGFLIAGDVLGSFDAGRNCSGNCFRSGAPIIPELVHVPHGNNNSHFIPRAPVMGIAGVTCPRFLHQS